jgi:hypothetical protein
MVTNAYSKNQDLEIRLKSLARLNDTKKSFSTEMDTDLVPILEGIFIIRHRSFVKILDQNNSISGVYWLQITFLSI